MLTACTAIQAGLLANVKQTKPLVSTGGVGLGYERGEMSDKLKYWCAPAREAMERMNLSEEDQKKVEAFPIDRTRGLSVPAMEWMIFDEMQNAPKSLFDAATTRAEQDDKSGHLWRHQTTRCTFDKRIRNAQILECMGQH